MLSAHRINTWSILKSSRKCLSVMEMFETKIESMIDKILKEVQKDTLETTLMVVRVCI